MQKSCDESRKKIRAETAASAEKVRSKLSNENFTEHDYANTEAVLFMQVDAAAMNFFEICFQ
jgi:hypothetical protein